MNFGVIHVFKGMLSTNRKQEDPLTSAVEREAGDKNSGDTLQLRPMSAASFLLCPLIMQMTRCV